MLRDEPHKLWCVVDKSGLIYNYPGIPQPIFQYSRKDVIAEFIEAYGFYRDKRSKPARERFWAERKRLGDRAMRRR